MTKSRDLNWEFLIALTFPEPWNLSLCSVEDAPTRIICLHILPLRLTWRYQPKVPGQPASYTEAICSSVAPFLLMIYGTSPHWSAVPPRRPPRWDADVNDPRVALTSCKADLMRVELLRWRLQTHLMAAEAPNYTHLHPYLGGSYSTETSAPLAEELQSIFLQFRPCQQRLQGGWSWTSCCFSSTCQVHLLWIKMPSLYAPSQILYSRKQESEPSDTTSATTADDQQKGNLSPCEDAEDLPSYSRHMESFSLSINYGLFSGDGTASCCYLTLNITY